MLAANTEGRKQTTIMCIPVVIKISIAILTIVASFLSIFQLNYDGGDCAQCKVFIISKIGNGVCGGEYIVASCGYDGGDYEQCSVSNISLVCNGVCDGGEYNVDSCGYE